MPSGAKKRKAAKKKLQNDNKVTNFDDGSHSFGNDDAKCQDERVSDSGEGLRESSEEPVVSNHAEVNEEVSMGEQNVTEVVEEEKSEGSYNDVPVNVEEVEVREIKDGELKRLSSSSSSSSSSSGDDEVAVEKEKVLVEEEREVEKEVLSSLPEVSREDPVISEVMYNSIEESIPVEESVKQVVSLPDAPSAEKEDETVDCSVTSHVAESEKKQTSDVPSVNEEDRDTPGMTDFVDKIEAKVIQVVDEGSEKLSGFVDMAARDGENLLPPSSGVSSADAACGNNHVKESETHKYIEEQPFISSAPLPVRQTSWTNCCGLFEVFSGGANR